MKKALSIALALALCFSMAVTSALAAAPQQTTERITFEDGSYLDVITRVYSGQRGTDLYAEKDYVYRTGLGFKLFTYTLCGWFTYTGTSSTCTAVDYAYVLNNSNWDIDTHSERRSGNTAYGSASFSAPKESKDVSITLSCDKNGNVT